MELDDRSRALLQEVFVNAGLKLKDLSAKYGLSRGQIDYTFKKINDWLKANDLPPIIKDSRGLFVGDSQHQRLFIQEEGTERGSDYVFSSEERTQLLCFVLLTKKDDLSLTHLTLAFEVSKNTVLADLKKAQEIAESYGLNILYSRVNGYDIKGDEWNKRRLLLAVVEMIQKLFNGAHFLDSFGHFKEGEIKKMKDLVSFCETELHIRFTDEKHNALPYLFASILRRIGRDMTIDGGSVDLSHEKVYDVLTVLLDGEERLSREEQSFLALQILTANLSFSSELERMTEPVMMSGLRQMVKQFEQISCTTLHDCEDLLQKLWLHLKPAYYRIRFGLIQNTFMDEGNFNRTFHTELKELHHLVRKSITPLEQVIGYPIPDEECKYFTMLIGGWMAKHGDSLQRRIKALVVCQNGVSVSKLMKSSLNALFPEFVFMDALSVRDFRTYSLEYDIVFSPVYLNTDKKLFVVQPFIHPEEKERLRNQVMQVTYGFTPPSVDSEDLIRIVSKYANIHNERGLKREFSRYLKRGQMIETTSFKEEKLDLIELLFPDHIRVKSEVNSWREAIELASQPLLENGNITTKYIEKMIEIHDVERPYVVYGTDLAIPHAMPEDGVDRLGMSMLKIEHGVKLSPDQSVRIIVILAPVDKNKHLRALLQLSQISESQEKIEKIVKSNSPKDVYECLKNLLEEEALPIG
ncbi:BglG family transcription antiterminator [Peribacillus frigoritolerans]|uniref:BglG family transcription antiterminator n=1 Tax=Peribacillus frigoritolerans TaxID=450367 RepID=UPI003F801400